MLVAFERERFSFSLKRATSILTIILENYASGSNQTHFHDVDIMLVSIEARKAAPDSWLLDQLSATMSNRKSIRTHKTEPLLNLVNVGGDIGLHAHNWTQATWSHTLILDVFQPGSCHKCSRGWWVSMSTQHRHAFILGPETQHLDTICRIRTDLAQEGTSTSLKRGFLCLVEAKHPLLQECLLECLLLFEEKDILFL